MRLPGAIASACAAVCLLSGCGSPSASDQVRAKVQQFAAAAAHHDYVQICNHVLSISLLERLAAGGTSCEGAMAVALGGVQRPQLSIGKIHIAGASAQVLTLTVAAGQQASLAEIDLVREGGGWRISALGGAQAARLFGR